MNLLQLLLGMMTNNNSVQSVSQQSGISSDKVKKLLMLAIPLLIRYMTQNASNQNGALSLFNALGQHNRQADMSKMIETADKEDGSKIIGHILGNDNDTVVRSLANETGLKSGQVAGVLSLVAPALLSALGAATQSAQKKDDMSDLFGLFGGSAPTQQQSGLSLLGNLFGGSQQTQTQANTGLFGNLFGGSKPQEQESSFDGSDLMKKLIALAIAAKK